MSNHRVVLMGHRSAVTGACLQGEQAFATVTPPVWLGMQALRSLPLWLVVTSLICCGGPSNGRLDSDARSCEPALAGSSSPTPSHPLRPARQVATEAEIGLRDGMISDPLGAGILILDRGVGAVIRVRPDTEPSIAFGRFGRGPGELVPAGAARILPYWMHDWIDAWSDTVAIFDGNAIHVYTASGAFLTSYQSFLRDLPPGLKFAGRLRHVPSGFLLDIEPRPGGSRGKAQRRTLGFWRIDHKGASQVATITLPPLPLRSDGTPYQGVTEATPVWDLNGTCVAVNDGGSPWILLVSYETGAIDTVPVTLPERTTMPSDEEARTLALAGGGAGALPAPTLPRKVLWLTTDNAGMAWLWLGPLSDSVDVAVLDPIGGTQRALSPPAFPWVFGDSSIYYGIRRALTGERTLWRVGP